jgi:ComF family protein
MRHAEKTWLTLVDRIIDEWAGITFPRPVIALGMFEPSEGCYWCGADIQWQSVCDCRSARLQWSRVFRLGAYEDPLSACILGGKYAAWKEMLEHLGTMLGAQVRGCVPPNTFIVPIPMPPIRRYFRRINHAGVIAKSISQASGLPIRRVLWKKDGISQASKSAFSRKQMHRNSVLLRPLSRLKGKNILLVDDVLTTGRTLEVAASILKKGGAVSVRVAVLAVTKISNK